MREPMTWRRALWALFAAIWIGIAVTVVISAVNGRTESFTSTPDP